MIVLICGSRDWPITLYNEIKGCIEALPDDTTVIAGAARSVDRIAAEYAVYWGLEVKTFPADWRTHGKAAGPIRNRLMLDQEPSLVIAFQRDGSRGTQDTIDEARRRGIPVEVHKATSALPLSQSSVSACREPVVLEGAVSDIQANTDPSERNP
jgi:hypothetical protein